MINSYWTKVYPIIGGITPLAILHPIYGIPPFREEARKVYEFKTMVKTLHSAGIEVILDVVYNHTGEGNHLGPDVEF